MAKGAVIEANDSNYTKLLPKNGKVIVVFKAAWCGPCKALSPWVDKIAAEYPGVTFIRVDEANAQKTLDAYKVRAFPTIKAFRTDENGKPGAMKDVPGGSREIRAAAAAL